MNRLIEVQTRRSIELTKQIASSGEGSVWRTNCSGLLAKVYHQPSVERIQKLEVMLKNPPEEMLAHIGHTSYAWPVAILENEKGQRVGFLMPEIKQGRQLTEIYNPSLRKRLKLEVDWQFLHTTAYNFALLMESIHKAGYVIGDVKPENILVNPQALPSIIDTDSFQVRDPEGHIYRCPVGSEGFTPPELIGKNFKEVDQTEVHDRFRLGVIAFTLLFGYEPFKGVWKGGGEPPELNEWVRHNYWPYSGNGKVGLADYMMPLDIVHPDLKNLFLRCFNDGYSVPAMRPSAREWRLTLGMAIAELQVCSVVETHLYHRGNSSCCWCERVAKGLPDIFLFNRTVPKVTPQPKSQTPTFVRWMSTSQIVADYPQHRTGQSINIKGNNYNDVSYLKPFGDLVFTNYCPIHPSMMQNGEYRWQVLERIYGNSSQIEIHGYSEQGSFVAGVLFGTRVPNGSTNFNATKINEFSADKSSVITGESFNLRWNTQNAKSVMIIAPGRIFDGRTFPNVGSVQVNASSSPGKDTYILVAKGCDSYGNNMDVQQQIEIDVKSNPIAIASDSGNKTLPTVSNHTNKAISKNNQVPVKEDKLVFLFDIAVKGTLIFSLGTGAYGLISFLYSQFNAITSSNSSVIIKSENDHNHQENAKDELQDYQRAIADYDQAISLNPNDANTYNNRGKAKYKLKDYSGAVADYDQAISLNPNDASAYNNRGIAKYELKDYPGAIADYTQAIRINSNDANAYNNRGIAKIFFDDRSGGCADLSRAIDLGSQLASRNYQKYCR
jgi:Flp pilus assembly protein TadD